MADSSQSDFSQRALVVKQDNDRANPPHHYHLINEHEAAYRLGLKVATLRRWRWEGRLLRFYKIGNAVRYDPGDVDAFIASSRRTSTSDFGVEL